MTLPLPLALHVGSSSVPIEHGIVGGLLHSFAVQLDGLGPQLAGKGLVGLLLDPLQVWGQLHLGAAGKKGAAQVSCMSFTPGQGVQCLAPA